jgi:uracil-DNA glycosylase
MVNLEKIYSQNKNIFPKKENVFKFLIDNPKVVILGQDPYHNDFQATGLAFAVPNNVNNPPSLQNIFKELKNDLNIIKINSDLID